MQLTQIQDLVDRINGCTFAGLDCITTIELSGARRVIKKCFNARVILFTNKKSDGYENMVRRRLEQEGKDPDSFVLGQLAWGKRLPNSPLIMHEGKHYLQVIFLAEPRPEYYLDGQRVRKRDIKGFPKDKLGSGRQGLEDKNKVVVRTYALESIKCIRLFGEQRCEVVEFQLESEDDLLLGRNQQMPLVHQE